MNIFILHNDPYIAARMHVDKHVVKMILESAQLLSTAHRVLDGAEIIETTALGRKKKIWTLSDARDTILYRATHINHPCGIWTRQSRENYYWLWELTQGLCNEYYLRYGEKKAKRHKVEESGLLDVLRIAPHCIPGRPGITPFAQAMPEKYKDKDATKAYRAYYLGEKKAMIRYTNRPQPAWI